jgi:16S rRNA (cytosine1407-C5)-methyltransferase
MFLQLLSKYGITFIELKWYKDALILPHSTSRELTALPEYNQGLFYIQNLSSMIPALVLDPKKDDLVLDLAAAPGSKTTQLAALMQNSGEIVANDISSTRIFKLKSVLETLGITNTKTINMPGEKVWQKYPEHFDKVLIDSPCSMEGRFTLLEEKSFSQWSTKKVKQLAKQQQWLLRSAISATKVGGTIVYSTCTIAPEENEGVIEWILQKEKEAVIIEPIILPEFTFQPVLKEWKNKPFSTAVSNTCRILPSHSMEGFYIAKIRKVKSTARYIYE